MLAEKSSNKQMKYILCFIFEHGAYLCFTRSLVFSGAPFINN